MPTTLTLSWIRSVKWCNYFLNKVCSLNSQLGNKINLSSPDAYGKECYVILSYSLVCVLIIKKAGTNLPSTRHTSQNYSISLLEDSSTLDSVSVTLLQHIRSPFQDGQFYTSAVRGQMNIILISYYLYLLLLCHPNMSSHFSVTNVFIFFVYLASMTFTNSHICCLCICMQSTFVVTSCICRALHGTTST
jgi:hypothetical protein